MTTRPVGPEEEHLFEAQVIERREQSALTITRYVAWATAVFALFLGAVWLVFRQYTQLLAIGAIDLHLAAAASLYPYFRRQGHSRAGIVYFLVSILAVVFVGMVVMPDAILAVTIGYVLVITLSNMLLDNRASRWMGACLVLAFTTDVVLISFWTPAWFPQLQMTTGLTAAIIAINTFALLATAVIIYNILTSQEDLFRQFQRANWAIEQRAVAEQQRGELLQATVQEYVTYMAEVGRGNLSARLTLDGQEGEKDPLTTLGYNLNEMTASLQGMIMQIHDAVGDLNAAATEILAATTQQATGANEQSAAISQMTTTVDEVKTIAEQLVTRAQEVTTIAQRTVNVSLSGRRSIKETITGMSQTKDRVERIAESILAVSEQTQQIGEIVSAVDNIASQSNMLALNASVEAARAGEHGKGFAVVAAEVRTLAEKSRKATMTIKDILSEIQSGINATVIATEEGSKRADAGVQLTEQTQEVIDQLDSVIQESAHAATQIAASGHQQASGMEQVAIAMQNINQATTQNLNSTRQAERAAENLNQLAHVLSETVEQYRL